jgi:HD-GYP domain-containing protein (c-di-GMP phosphodiesterase class II)
MLRVPIAYAKSGMVLAMPIFHPRRHDTILLKAGLTLDERTIQRLTELRISEFWIRYPGLETLSDFISPEVAASQACVAHAIADTFNAISTGAHARLDYTDYKNAIGGLLTRLSQNPKAALFVQEMVDRDQPALRHSTSVCLTSVLMGLKLEDYLVAERTRMAIQTARDVSSLGLGAMLHDIGMLRLDPHTVERWNSTQNEADPAWRQHVILGYEMVRDSAGPTASAIVLNHHQKFDGSGFPGRKRLDGSIEPVSGRDIHVFVRIVAAADLFDRLRNPPGAPADQPPIPIVRALRQLREHPYADWVDPMVFRALLSVAPAYAPGTLVRLSTGEQAVVTDWYPNDPCRPAVQVVGDGLDPAAPAPAVKRYSLRQNASITIVQAEGQDVSGDNFYPAHPGEFDLKLAGRALYNRAASLALG